MPVYALTLYCSHFQGPFAYCWNGNCYNLVIEFALELLKHMYTLLKIFPCTSEHFFFQVNDYVHSVGVDCVKYQLRFILFIATPFFVSYVQKGFFQVSNYVDSVGIGCIKYQLRCILCLLQHHFFVSCVVILCCFLCAIFWFFFILPLYLRLKL